MSMDLLIFMSQLIQLKLNYISSKWTIILQEPDRNKCIPLLCVSPHHSSKLLKMEKSIVIAYNMQKEVKAYKNDIRWN